ncbi:MAG: NAD(P)H-binding protein [Pseudomonadota bacterium]|nr:NAD(P)H-binding protein [Pseudomonadota bacterium]
MGSWMLYGANGYTAGLMLEIALKRGHRPVLAGRNRDAIESLARKHELPARIFDLEDPNTVSSALNGIEAVMHCAGPFSATSAPMLEGCLKSAVHYLDITGEMEVFAHCHQRNQRAQERGIVVMPGTGFDVVPTDCLAAMLKRDLPDAIELVLAFEAGGGPSHGTALTAVEGLSKGGRVRRDGQIVRVPLAYKTRTFDRDGEARHAMTIPWGDVYTAYVSTGIPNVEVYMGVSPSTAARLKKLNLIRPLLGLGLVQNFMKKKIRAGGPDDSQRGSSGCTIWGEVRNAAGAEVKKQLRTVNGYDLTATAAMGILDHVIAKRPAGGFYTASQMMGADYILSLPGSTLHA